MAKTTTKKKAPLANKERVVTVTVKCTFSDKKNSLELNPVGDTNNTEVLGILAMAKHSILINSKSI